MARARTTKPAGVAYRGYLIRAATGAWWIEKDGFLIAHAKDLADAKAKIDGLLD